jgi:hypothetical protein
MLLLVLLSGTLLFQAILRKRDCLSFFSLNVNYDGKAVSILTGTGGLADVLPEWYPRLRKKSESAIIWSKEPETVVAYVLQHCALMHDAPFHLGKG